MPICKGNCHYHYGKGEEREDFSINPATGELFKTCDVCRKYYSKRMQQTERRREERIRSKNKSHQLRYTILIFYSEGQGPHIPRCACCGETSEEFLAIDHTNGGGNRHRKAINFSPIYQWLKSNKYPMGYRVLCHDCNMSFAFYGYCPHDKE
jgi:hypothetical protein